ncbi:hypothetical protein RDI58_013476 [Solanum bulbocastanum]|uniref:Uncharacterized protein n=1 Tax=Solanum bulbocastanum TaxID=147425 RepID=A0AAN8TQD2_SOLBU
MYIGVFFISSLLSAVFIRLPDILYIFYLWIDYSSCTVGTLLSSPWHFVHICSEYL